MNFDVIIGNPPYQRNDGSGAADDSAVPVYNIFIDEVLKLNPQYLTMIIPSKWMVGGRGLQPFREKMVADRHIKYMYDFENASDCFNGLNIDGGVCYFFRDRNYNGLLDYAYKTSDGKVEKSKRFLQNDSLAFKFVIRNTKILSIIEKIESNQNFSKIVSSRKPFGIETFLFNNPERYPDANLQFQPYENSLKVYGVKGIKGGAKRIIGYVSPDIVTNNKESVEKYKLFFTKSYSTNAIKPPEIIVGEPNSVCTETFLLVGPFDSKEEQSNCLSYMNTKFFKSLLYFGKGTMQVTKAVFGLIPLQSFAEEWTDAKLYAKYGLSAEEIAFIDGMIK